MKRHPALEPFSRDHNDALVLARKLIQSRPGASDDFLFAWKQEIQDHFEQEERLLVPLADTNLADRLKSEHSLIEELVSQLPHSTVRLGIALESHVRWEERELFPWLEAEISTDVFLELEVETTRLEERRWSHSPLRKELVLRRRNAAL